MNDYKAKMRKWNKLSKILGFTPKLEGMSSEITKTLVLDVFWLSDQFPLKENQSLKDYITETYGKKTTKLIEALISVC